mmetsp:Transcript_24005/g.44034  ORF Transcript_24005/g.44034 Transcript_24005/m.44034 type:complete len:225 (-) Transcript_24005:1882-2556(-)
MRRGQSPLKHRVCAAPNPVAGQITEQTNGRDAQMGRGCARSADLADPGRNVVGTRDSCHWRGSGGGCETHDIRRAWVHLWLGLHALLRDKFHVHGTGGRRGVSCGPVQHWRRGSGDAGRSWRGTCVPLYPLAALDIGCARCDGRGRRLWCNLGGDPCIFAGQTGQSHRDHHDHVQLYRRGRPELHAGEHPAARRVHGPGNCPLSRGGASALAARPAGPDRDKFF